MTLFKRSVGQTINQAITRHRLDTAQSLLISTDRTITEVVYDAGFGSVSRFYEAFYGRFGERPTTFRQRMRARRSLSLLRLQGGRPHLAKGHARVRASALMARIQHTAPVGEAMARSKAAAKSSVPVHPLGVEAVGAGQHRESGFCRSVAGHPGG